ncbi:MAG: hypothetical protein PF637_05820, partial [Spirochaetes bacterium]|nr:hypothetical protein [Spirochaetota bacterium]
VDGEYTTFEFNTKTYDYRIDDTLLTSIPKKFNTPDEPMNMGTFTPELRYVGYEGGNKIRCIRYLNDIEEPLGEFVFEKK